MLSGSVSEITMAVCTAIYPPPASLLTPDSPKACDKSPPPTMLYGLASA